MKQTMRAFALILATISLPINLCCISSGLYAHKHTHGHIYRHILLYTHRHANSVFIYLNGDYDYAKKYVASWFSKNNTVDP